MQTILSLSSIVGPHGQSMVEQVKQVMPLSEEMMTKYENYQDPNTDKVNMEADGHERMTKCS